MGLTWDEGVEKGGSFGPYRQSERLAIYADHAQQLIAAGTGYYCFCSAEKLDAERQAMLRAGLPPKYAGTCRSIPPRRGAVAGRQRREGGHSPARPGRSRR